MAGVEAPGSPEAIRNVALVQRLDLSAFARAKPKKFERGSTKRTSGGAADPAAVCGAMWARKSDREKRAIVRGEERGNPGSPEAIRRIKRMLLRGAKAADAAGAKTRDALNSIRSIRMQIAELRPGEAEEIRKRLDEAEKVLNGAHTELVIARGTLVPGSLVP